MAYYKIITSALSFIFTQPCDILSKGIPECNSLNIYFRTYPLCFQQLWMCAHQTHVSLEGPAQTISPTTCVRVPKGAGAPDVKTVRFSP